MWRITSSFITIVLAVAGASAISTRLWSGKQEQLPQTVAVDIDKNTTVAEFGKKYDLDRKSLKKIFDLRNPDDLKKQVAEFGLTEERLNKNVNQVLAIQAEHASKNWFKIPLKGILWIVFLIAIFILVRRGRITSGNRKWLYIVTVGVFGVFLGSDPSPMGTVKDAIVLFGSKGVIFPPRLIAFSIFLLSVILANKFICSWGCQLGTLQDLIFRLNRNSKDRKGLFGQVKMPFIISNSIRVLFFLGLILVAFIWAADIIGLIDPFKIFKPQVIGITGGLFLGLILVVSLFVYRPWCHFFCPFGLVGWLAEKVSFFKIKVNYDKCISCQACSKACPSTVMDAILKRDRIVPDCFSCGTCMETCPVNAISFERGKRHRPPTGKFDKKGISD